MLLALLDGLDADVDPNSSGTMRTSDDYIDSNVRLALSAAGMVSKHTSLQHINCLLLAHPALCVDRPSTGLCACTLTGLLAIFRLTQEMAKGCISWCQIEQSTSDHTKCKPCVLNIFLNCTAMIQHVMLQPVKTCHVRCMLRNFWHICLFWRV